MGGIGGGGGGSGFNRGGLHCGGLGGGSALNDGGTGGCLFLQIPGNGGANTGISIVCITHIERS